MPSAYPPPCLGCWLVGQFAWLVIWFMDWWVRYQDCSFSDFMDTGRFSNPDGQNSDCSRLWRNDTRIAHFRILWILGDSPIRMAIILIVPGCDETIPDSYSTGGGLLCLHVAFDPTLLMSVIEGIERGDFPFEYARKRHHLLQGAPLSTIPEWVLLNVIFWRKWIKNQSKMNQKSNKDLTEIDENQIWKSICLTGNLVHGLMGWCKSTQNQSKIN